MLYLNKRVEVDVDIEIDSDDFSDEDLIEELEERGYSCEKTVGCEISLDDLYELKRNSSIEFDKVFADYCYQEIGRIL